MQLIVRFFLFLAIAIGLAFLLDTYGFAIAHSGFAGALAFLFSPGIILVFATAGVDPSVKWVLVVILNVLYYQLIYLFCRRGRNINKSR